MAAFVVLIGAPGAGKGTQAGRIAPALGLFHLATGDMFREAAKEGTDLGLKARAYMDRGDYVPDEITLGMVMERLQKPDSVSGVLLDGFPRTLRQAEALSEVLGGDGRAVNQAVYLVVPQKELIRRLSGRWLCSQCQAPYHVISHPPKQEGRCDLCGGELYQRSDDTSETARHRLGVYFKQTTPVIDYYRGQGVLDEVNGDRDFEVVEQDLIQAVRKRKAL